MCTNVRLDNGRWISASGSGSGSGEFELVFAPTAEFGILDHDVTLSDGARFNNPLRVLRNDDGSEIVFTLYRRPGTADEDFDRDAALVCADLLRLRDIIEASA